MDVILMLLLLGILSFTPYYSKQDILFGYRVGQRLGNSPEARQLKRQYTLNTSVSLIIITLLSWLFIAGPVSRVGIIPVLYIVVSYLNFYYTRRKARQFFESHKQEISPENRVIVSIDTQNSGVSVLWFLIPVLFIIASGVLLYVRYDQLPDQIPMRYDLQGNVTGYEEKNLKNLALLPGINLITTIIMFYVFMTIHRAKQELSGSDLREAKIRNEKFKKGVSQIVVYLVIVLNVLFFFQLLTITLVIPQNALTILVNVIFVPVVIIPPIVLAVKMGQGGSRIKVDDRIKEQSHSGQQGQKELVRDDNKYWKFGLFYYNPQDSSVWVEKRFGVGYTLNFAKPHAWLFFGGIVILLVGLFLIV